jgi:hypothetical protein
LPKVGFFKRLFGRAPEPPPPPPAPPAVHVPAMEDDDALAVLTATLDALGFARHRPFSRS